MGSNGDSEERRSGDIGLDSAANDDEELGERRWLYIIALVVLSLRPAHTYSTEDILSPNPPLPYHPIPVARFMNHPLDRKKLTPTNSNP